MLGDDGLSLAAAPLAPYGSRLDCSQVRAMIDAAADAGFSGMSIDTAHHDWAVADGMASEEFFDYHRRRGMSIPAAEVILDWATCDRRAIAEASTHILDVAARAGAASVITAMLEPELPPLRDAAARLAQVCDLAAERGLAISYEFLPPTGVPNIASAARLLEAVDRENFGLVLDPWHWHLQPGGPDILTLRGIPPERIHILQLGDAPARIGQDWVKATMTARLPAGEGVIDIARLLGALEDMGASPVIVSEVFSDHLRSLGVAESARRQFAAATSVLARHQASIAAPTAAPSTPASAIGVPNTRRAPNSS